MGFDAYSQTLTAAGGTPTYNFSLLSGTLPTGIRLAANGTLAGMATAPGAFTFTVQVQDAAGNNGTRTYTLAIYPAVANSRRIQRLHHSR